MRGVTVAIGRLVEAGRELFAIVGPEEAVRRVKPIRIHDRREDRIFGRDGCTSLIPIKPMAELAAKSVGPQADDAWLWSNSLPRSSSASRNPLWR